MSLPTTMKAITYASTGGVEVLDFTPDFAVPTPQPTEFVIKVAYAGVNMIDTYFRCVTSYFSSADMDPILMSVPFSQTGTVPHTQVPCDHWK
jgi:NADPH:quinone reductase-like Zn-dependent oxidoreductase